MWPKDYLPPVSPPLGSAAPKYSASDMALLDDFAKAALIGMLSGGSYNFEDVGVDAYRYAETMLAEKRKREIRG